MGKIVSVWSSTKRVGKTVFLFNLVKHLSKLTDKNINILVVCTNLIYGNLIDMFDVSDNELSIEDIINYKIHPENSFDILHSLANRENLYFLGSKITSPNYAANNITRYDALFDEFKDKFDLTLVDTSSGRENALTNLLLNKSDHILNIISQDKERLDKYPFKNSNDLFYIINNYKDIFPSEKDLSSLYKLNQIFKLPSCSVLFEMKNKGLLEFYDNHETPYNEEMQSIAKFLSEKLNLKFNSEVQASSTKKSFLKNILGGKLS